MFGWEFPPVFAGGVGMVCYNLTNELTKQGVKLTYIVPFSAKNIKTNSFTIKSTKDSRPEINYEIKNLRKQQDNNSNLEIRKINSLLSAYITEEEFQTIRIELEKQNSLYDKIKKITENNNKTNTLYGEHLIEEVELFKRRISSMVKEEEISKDEFDIIHAHDWTTLPAGEEVKKLTGKPFIAHVHITEFNKSGGQGINQEIYEIEKKGLKSADKIFAVSKSIKQTLIEHYDVEPEKITVLYNASAPLENEEKQKTSKNKKITKNICSENEQLVSFMGRITGMKGPENFVRMAKKVLEHRPNTKFLVAGTGDKLPATIQLTKKLGIEDKFYFHGFYSREEANEFFEQTDVFVLPSLMEPFGLTPLEAMRKNTPVIISKQSGVSEVINHCFRVDFWDINKMASQVISLLTHPELRKEMITRGLKESKSKTWDKTAKECINNYSSILNERLNNKEFLSNKTQSKQHTYEGGNYE